MKKLTLKTVSLSLATLCLFNPIATTSGQVKASTIQNEENQKETEEYIKYKEAWIKAIDEMPKSDFKDPSAKQELKNNIAASEDRGKATIAAKVAAKGIQSVLKKVGQKGWDNLVKKVENTTGTELVALHYKSITGLVNILANSQKKATTVISGYLQDNGLNKTVANAAAATFVAVIL